MNKLHKLRVYLDTSVISHLQAFDAPEKMKETEDFWDIIKKRSNVQICLSTVTMIEINRCSEPKLTYLLQRLTELETHLIDEEIEDLQLANIYLSNGVLREKSKDDLRHIAIAVMHGCRYIVSWNFKHFVNPKTINAVAAVNRMNNLPEINIVSPSMMVGGF